MSSGAGMTGRPLTERGGQDVADADGVARQTPCFGYGGRGEVHEPGPLERVVGCGRGIGDQWRVEPGVGRVADGVPARVDRLRALGNGLVPQIAEWIGRRIVAYETEHLERVA